METLNAAINQVNTILWSYVLIVLLIGLGLYFTFRTGFVQIRLVGEMVRLLAEGIGTERMGNQISSFQAFCVSTASRVGVGNIAGVAIAIVLGGPGAIFWMWMTAILGGASKDSVSAMEKAGSCVGIAFQIQDDILDIVGDQAEIGKPVGSDEKNNKSTYVSLNGMEAASAKVKELSEMAEEILKEQGFEDSFLGNLFDSLIYRRK